MVYLKYIKYALVSLGAILIGLFFSLTGYKRGKQSGVKQANKEFQRAETKRKAVQSKVNAIQEEARSGAMDIHNANSVDAFNRLFEHPPDHPND